MAASVFPDWDIVPGLLAGYGGVQFHRGATHSPVGVVLQALLMTPVGLALWTWLRKRLKLAPAPRARLLFAVLLAGMGLHAAADALNPWGVAPFWPISRAGATWNLVHEGDPVFLAVAALCAGVAFVGSARGIALVSVLAFGSAVVWKAGQRDDAVEIARRELGGAPVSVFPSPAQGCPWTALARTQSLMRAACVAPGGEPAFRMVRSVASAESPLVEASKADPAVADFLAKRGFPFAELEEARDGGRVVLWCDLRETLLEGPDDPRFGLAVRFDAAGEIVSVEHRWMLKVAF